MADLNPSGINLFQYQQGEFKEKQEEEVEKRSLPFDIIKTALSNLNSETVLSPTQLNEKVSNILTSLSNDDLSVLKTLPPNNENNNVLLKLISDLVKNYKQFKDAKTIPDTNTREILLENVFSSLMKAGDIDKAIEVANSMPDANKKGVALGDIFNHLIAVGDINKATKVANTIPDDEQKWFAFIDLVEDLTKVGNIGKAIEIANEIPDSYLKFRLIAMQAISNILAKAGNIDKAIEIAITIPDDDQRTTALKYVVSDGLLTIVNTQNVKRAIAVADAVTDANVRGILHGKINEILKESETGA